VNLASGGYIIVEPTEALVSIDVNTGRYTGKKDPEKTILKTNVDAAREIARQLRLRDVGGIIVCDFIDMESKQNREKVLQELRSTCRATGRAPRRSR
jgi:ribonuclease G